MKNIALYAGSFDPITIGHMDIIAASVNCFDKVILALIKNPSKPAIRHEKRLEWAERAINGDYSYLKFLNPSISVDIVSYLDQNILTVDVAKKHNATFLVRGIKGVTSLEEEMQLSFNNDRLEPSIRTVWFPVSQNNYHVSSSAVRSILQCSDFSIKETTSELFKKLSDKYLPHIITADVIEYFKNEILSENIKKEK